MTTFISIRVSTKEQAVDGTSLVTQVKECLAYCRLHDLTSSLHPDSNMNSPGVFADPGVSAWKKNLLSRPGFLEIWRRAKPGDTVLFYSLDRAFRSMRDFCNSYELFQERGINPVIIRDNIRMDTAAGSLWARVRVAFAEYQSAIISERVKESYAIRRQRAAEAGSGSKEAEKSGGESEPGPQLPDSVEITDDIRRICTFRGISGGEKVKGRVFFYARVSTGEQDPDVQQQILARHREFYLEQGYQDGGEYVDHGVSAYYRQFRDRPAGKQIWVQLQPGDMIVVVRLDRIFRSIVDMGQSFQEWETNGTWFADCTSGLRTDTVGGKAMANFLCMMAQWESESISWRTKLAMQHLQLQRGPWAKGRTPQWVQESSGVLVDGSQVRRLEVDREIVRDMIQMRNLSSQGLTANEIGDMLQTEYEVAEDLPIPVPRSGLDNRWSVEQKMRRRGQWSEMKRLRAYCDRHKIPMTGRIERAYPVEDQLLRYLVSAARDENGVFNRYVKSNGLEE